MDFDLSPEQLDLVERGAAAGLEWRGFAEKWDHENHAPLGAVLCRQHVYDAIERGSREFDLGHTWDGAPLSSAVGLAVLNMIAERGLGMPRAKSATK